MGAEFRDGRSGRSSCGSRHRQQSHRQVSLFRFSDFISPRGGTISLSPVRSSASRGRAYFLPEGWEILHLFHFYGIVSGIKIPHTAGKRSLS